MSIEHVESVFGIRLKVSNYDYPILLIFFQKRRFSRYFTDKANAMVEIEIYRFSTKMLKILTWKLPFEYYVLSKKKKKFFFQVHRHITMQNDVVLQQ